MQNNENNLADGLKSTVENNTNEAESDIIVAALATNNNSTKSDIESEKPNNNVETDEVHTH